MRFLYNGRQIASLSEEDFARALQAFNASDIRNKDIIKCHSTPFQRILIPFLWKLAGNSNSLTGIFEGGGGGQGEF